MHTPNNPQKYLRRSFYGEYSQSGVPFLEVLKTDIHDQWYERISRDDGKQYLVLSTCYGSAKSGRLLIIATEN